MVETKHIYVMVDEFGQLTGWGSHRSSENEIEVEIEIDHPFLFDMPFAYSIVDGKLVKQEDYILKMSKKEKDEELNANCKEAIMAGFNHTIDGQEYWFSYDMEAQGNFRDGRTVLTDGLISELPWTVRIGGPDGEYSRIFVNLEIIKELSLIAMYHKTGQISKYRDFLMPLVDGAETVEEVNSVVW